VEKKLPETLAALLKPEEVRDRRVRLMFQDEARFGRMVRIRRCWAPTPERPVVLVRRGIVTGVVSDVKTKYSNAGIPLDPALAEVLLNWQRKTLFKKLGIRKPVRGRQDALVSLGSGAASHHPRRRSLRYRTDRLAHVHTFRTLLDETGASMKVRQKLMRHVDIRKRLRQGYG